MINPYKDFKDKMKREQICDRLREIEKEWDSAWDVLTSCKETLKYSNSYGLNETRDNMQGYSNIRRLERSLDVFIDEYEGLLRELDNINN